MINSVHRKKNTRLLFIHHMFFDTGYMGTLPFTSVPNDIFDRLLPYLSMAELKLLLVIIRQTHGWRKKRDWITQGQFAYKTGLSRQTISETLGVLQHHGLIHITDREGVELQTSSSRKGRSRLYYSLGDPKRVGKAYMRCRITCTTLVGLSVQDKRNSTKATDTKGAVHIANILSEIFHEE